MLETNTVVNSRQLPKFRLPPVNGSYAECLFQLNKLRLYESTFGEIGDLACATLQNPDREGFCEVAQLLSGPHWLRGFTSILYGIKGAYIQDYPVIEDNGVFNRRIHMREEHLIKRLESSDPNVRFVPFGYKTGEQSSRDLTENPFVIALVNGEDRAEELGETAKKIRKNCCLLSCDPSKKYKEPNIMASGLYLTSISLVVCAEFGVAGFDDGDGYAFGLIKDSNEATC